MSIQAIEKGLGCSIAKEILEFFSFLGQAPIPLSLLEEWGKQFHPETPILELRNALRYLCDYSMIDSRSPKTYDIHLLVQSVTRYQMSKKEKQTQVFKQAVMTLTPLMSQFKSDEVDTWEPAKGYLPHGTTLAENEELMETVNLEQQWKFMNALGSIHHILGNHPQQTLKLQEKSLDLAKEWECRNPNSQETQEAVATSYHDIGLALYSLGRIEEALGLWRKALEKVSPFSLDDKEKQGDTASIHDKIGVALKDLGRTSEALGSLQKAHAIRVSLHVKNHPTIATSYNNTGAAHLDLGQASEALDFFQKALKIQCDLYGENHPNIAISHNNIGIALQALRRTDEALKSLKQALKIRLSLYGENHPVIATGYNNIGAVLQDLKQTDEALESFQKALKIQIALYGKNHPAVATSYNNIGIAFQDLRRTDKTLEFHQKALKIQIALYGENHPAVAGSYNNMGTALLGLGRASEALKPFQKALEIKIALYGKNHPDVAGIYGNIGITLKGLGRASEALKPFQKALKIQIALYGENHSDLASYYGHLGQVFHFLGKANETLDSYEQALKIQIALYGENHSDVATSYNNIGIALRALAQTDEALEFHQKALKIQIALYGENHSDVATSYNNIGIALRALAQTDEALEFHQKALKIQIALYGENHSDVATSYNNIGIALRALAQTDEALEFHQKALKIQIALYGENHSDVATSYNNIGEDLQAFGRTEEALKTYQKALKICLSLHGDNHPAAATCYNNIGMAFEALGRADEALEVYQKALNALIVVYGENHPDVATCYANMGAALEDPKRVTEALDLYQKALKIQLDCYGGNHPHVATTYNNIGSSFLISGRYIEALNYTQKALQIRIFFFGENHPSVKEIYENIKCIQKMQGLLAILGEDHPLFKKIHGSNESELHQKRLINIQPTLNAVPFPCLQNTQQRLIYDLPSEILVSRIGEKQPIQTGPLHAHSFLAVIHLLSSIPSMFTTNKTDMQSLTKLLQHLAEQETFVFQGLFHEKIASIYRSIDVSLAKKMLYGSHHQELKAVLQKLGNDEKSSRLYFPDQELHLFTNSIFKNFYDYLFNDYAIKKSEIYLDFLTGVHHPLAFEEIFPAFQELQRALHSWLAEKHSFTPSLWSPAQPIGDLLKILRKDGPLMIIGQFGKIYYDQPPIELREEFFKKTQGWRSGAKRISSPQSNAVIVLGASQNGAASGGGYVYFVDPKDPNSTFYKISYQNLQTHTQCFELFSSYAVHLSVTDSVAIDTKTSSENLLFNASSPSPYSLPQNLPKLSSNWSGASIASNLWKNPQAIMSDEIVKADTKTSSESLLFNASSPSPYSLSKNPPRLNSNWRDVSIAFHLWKNPQATISDETVKKVQSVAAYLQREGFELGGIQADGNCFLSAFLESYKTFSQRTIPILDEQNDKVDYLRSCIVAEYPQESTQNRQRAQQIKKDKEWITAQGEGDLLAKGLSIPIRIITVHQDQHECGISDMLTFPDKESSRRDWKTISENEQPKEYIFIVDLGGHFLYAKKNN